jgi:hypothetical protein
VNGRSTPNRHCGLDPQSMVAWCSRTMSNTNADGSTMQPRVDRN